MKVFIGTQLSMEYSCSWEWYGKV